MLWVRKIFGALFAVILLVSLLSVVNATNLNLSLGSAETVKELAAESGLYDELVAAALESAQQDANTQNSSIPLNNVIVQQAAKQVFTPAYLEEKVNIIIDANYAWLAGKSPTPSFRIDTSAAKQDFAERVGAYVTKRLQGLPVCTDAQLAQLSTDLNPLDATCRPATVDPETEGQRVTSELTNSSFLSQPVLTADTVGRDPNSQTQPYYAELAKLPKAYQLSQKAPWIFGLAALLAAVAVIFLAPHRRKGLQRVGIISLVAGLILISTKLVASLAADQASSRLANTVSSQLEQPQDEFIHHLAATLTQVNLIAGAILVGLGLIILGYLHFTGRQKKMNRPEGFHDPAAPGSTIEPAAPKPPAPKKPQPAANTAPAPKPTASYNRPPTPQLRKRPPRPRGRDLIQ